MKKQKNHSFNGSFHKIPLFMLAFSMLIGTHNLSANEVAESTSVAQQQKMTVKGTVIDEFGDPVPGASVVEKGTTNGTDRKSVV